MKKLIFVISLSIPLFSNGFLTEAEHGENIYKATRGIACANCHGENNEGKIIVVTNSKNIESKILAPALKNLTLESLKKGIKNHKFAPPYYLSDIELQAMLSYLNSK